MEAEAGAAPLLPSAASAKHPNTSKPLHQASLKQAHSNAARPTHLRRLLQLLIQVSSMWRHGGTPRRRPSRGQAALNLRLLCSSQQAVQAAHGFVEERQGLAGG